MAANVPLSYELAHFIVGFVEQIIFADLKLDQSFFIKQYEFFFKFVKYVMVMGVQLSAFRCHYYCKSAYLHTG